MTVVDLSVHPAGAIAAMHLGEYGARVLRIDTASDAPTQDEALWRYANRTKDMVSAGDGVVLDLVARADVVIVDLPAGDLERAGLDAGRLRADNPSLVHAWMPPHAVRGPAAEFPADELLLWAWTGLASQQPGATSDHPVAPVVPIITYEQGALGATAIAAALIERATRGAVRSLTVSGLHAVNAMNTSIRIDLPGIFRPFGANKDGTGVSPQFRMYRCRDGVWVFVCALTPPFFFKLIEALDLMEIMLLPEVDGEFARFVQPEVQVIVNARFAERIDRLVLLAPAVMFAKPGHHLLPPERIEEWRRTGALRFFHYAYHEERPLGFSFYEDSLNYDAFDAPISQPTLVFQGMRDASVDYRTVEQFARGRANVTLSLLDDDHQLAASLPRIWNDVAPFLDLV